MKQMQRYVFRSNKSFNSLDYTPLGAGNKIDTADGPQQIVITQVLSEQAVYQSLQIAVSGDLLAWHVEWKHSAANNTHWEVAA